MSPRSIDTLPELEADDFGESITLSTSSSSSTTNSSSSSSPSDRQSSSTLNSRCSSSSSITLYNIPEDPSSSRPDLAIIAQPPNSKSSPLRLAVLLPQDLWKRDKDALKCDIFECNSLFSVFQRRHHCRKCGGIFCGACSSQTMPLLDTSAMPFIIPPTTSQIPLIAASSPAGALVPSRVCDECFRQLNGHRRVFSKSVSQAGVVTSPVSSPPSVASSSARKPSSSLSSVVCRPRVPSTPSRPKLTRANTGPLPSTAPGSPASSSVALPRRRRSSVRPDSPTPSSSSSAQRSSSSRAQPKQDLGILESYPLKMSSQGCKATGAAVWTPKEVPVLVNPSRPSYYSPIRVKSHDDEDDEDDMNGPTRIIVDGEFKVRAPYEPQSVRARREWSTF